MTVCGEPPSLSCEAHTVAGARMPHTSRRTFVTRAGLAAGSLSLLRGSARAQAAGPFQIAVITDEVSMDFDHACSVAAHDFGMRYVELRSLWNKNLQALSDTELAEAERILAKYSLSVTDIASPLFKVHWPGAPKSKYGGPADSHQAPETSFKQQDEVAERAVAQAKRFKTNKVRCFDFWRLDDQQPVRKAIDEHLGQTAESMRSKGVELVLENEFECNTATGREAARTLSAVRSPNFFLNWDPANAVMRGELDAFPAAWQLLPKDRIHHCHVKNAAKRPAGDSTGPHEAQAWAPVGIGYIDWQAQFAALKQAGYRHAVSLETHWTGGGTPEASTRKSWADMQSALEKSGTLA